jgi:phosphohistidine phosphatase SixA
MRSPSLILVLIATAAAPLSGQQSKGTLGVEAARRGGVVIVCRHGMTDDAREDEMTLRYDDPSTQRRLSARGERQSEAMGKAFRALGIPIGEVIASPMQRAQRTADLEFGAARVVQDSTWHTRGENYASKRQRRLEVLGQPAQRGNRVIVSHLGTIQSLLPSIVLEEGDCVVVRPRGSEKYDVIEVVPWRAWLRAAHLDDPVPQS